ncbi:PIR protein [Plasmodium vivax]|uniref:VIR protein n=1 Tax=Plasmodium vivax TaxID=5855 RepID=A0A565A4F3_PLAVI|nr:PIR protein [Plasmodium vivax]
MTYPTIKYSEYAGITPNDYPLLKNLSFYEFYEELDKELRSSTDSEPSCSQCANHIASQKSTGRELIALCKKVCNIILSDNDILGKCKVKTDDKPCQYMSYWLYDNVIRTSDNLTLFKGLYYILGAFTNSRNHYFNNCTLNNFNMDRNTFKKKHILYEFLESYDDMKNKIDSQNELYTPLYCKRVKEYFNFYNLIKDNCINDTCEYSNDLQNFKNKINKPEELTFIYEKCSDDNKKCQYMSHWLYDKVISITKGTDLVSNFYAALFMFSSSNKDNFKNCTLTKFNVDKEIFNKKHILYEFLESYDDIKKKIFLEGNLNVQPYCKHIKENFGAFTNSRNHYFNNCTLNNFNMDRNTFKKKHILYEFLESYDDMKNKIDSQNELYTPLYCKRVKEYFNFYNLIKDNCINDTCEYSNDLQNFKNKINKPEELTFIYEKCKYKSISCKHGTNGNDDVPCLGPQGNPLLFQIFGNDPDNIVNVLLNVAIISVPTLTIFLILFKFTPFGRKLNRINAKGRKTGHNEKEENIEDYMNNYAAYVDNVMKNRVNLAYHAS